MWTVIVRDSTGNIHSKTQLKIGVVTIGRSVDCDIVLASVSVSRLHGRLLVGEGPTLIYSDERSANGSYVDGQAVTGAVDVGVENSIKIGEFRVGFEREGMPPQFADTMNATVIYRPSELELIAQAPPKPASAPKPASVPPPAVAASRVPAAGAMKSALPGFEFKDLDTLVTPSSEPKKTLTLSESITGLLDQQIRGIQSHRDAQRASERSRAEIFEQQWNDAMTAARDLQNKLKGDARVLYYVISRGNDEVSVKLSDSSRRGHANLSLSKRHPETGRISEGVAWFSVFGEDPQPYREPQLALEDFVRRIAAKLA